MKMPSWHLLFCHNKEKKIIDVLIPNSNAGAMKKEKYQKEGFFIYTHTSLLSIHLILCTYKR
jgi:hypothetical protein